MKFILLLIIGLLPAIILSQIQVERSVLSPLGNSNDGAISVQSTLGESNIGIASGSSVIVTVGFQQNFDIALSTQNLPKPNVHFYPNPAHDILQIETSVEMTQIRIINAQGTVVSRYDTHREVASTIQVSVLPPGVYIVQVKMLSGQVKEKKIVIH